MSQCGAKAGECVCELDDNHEGPHECSDTARCAGAWEDRLGPFRIVRFPGLNSLIFDEETP